MDCADGTRRHCVPVLCQYLGDMEEQWLLTCQIKPACPKCPKRRYELYHKSATSHKVPSPDGTMSNGGRVSKVGRTSNAVNKRSTEGNVCSQIIRKIAGNPVSAKWLGAQRITERRTDAHAAEQRHDFRTGYCTPEELSAYGYHPQSPFSSQYPNGGILDGVGPDLLHQISKYFMDYLFNHWIYPVTIQKWRGVRGVADADVCIEIDSRFALVPKWTSMRWFKEGIISQRHSWSVHEFKDMMRQIIGVMIGICPPEGIAWLMQMRNSN